MNISEKERKYLRELAKKQLELANEDKNKELEKQWYQHNDHKGAKPLAVIEFASFYDDVAPELICENPFARTLEKEMKDLIMSRELLDDDRVVPDFQSIFLDIDYAEYDIEQTRISRFDESGKEQGFQYDHIIKDLKEDIHLLKPSIYSCDLQKTVDLAYISNEIMGDILPAKIRNDSVLWRACLTNQVVKLMGMENLFVSMYDYEDEVHQLMDFVTSDIINFMKWQEKEGLLTPNWGNEHAGSNSFGFTGKLPTHTVVNDNLIIGKTDILLADQWINTNSQETVGISKDMFNDFFLPYYKRLCSTVGAVYYGCCEPVDGVYTNGLDDITNIRKISVSPWCNEESIAEQIKGKDIVYSRKPSPNFLGIQKEFDAGAFRSYVKATMKAAKGLELEFIFRDVYTVCGNTAKLKQAVNIVRECSEDF